MDKKKSALEQVFHQLEGKKMDKWQCVNVTAMERVSSDFISL